ncbi:MAG TPA: class I SAM-dependent methyltransferase, partial [Acidiferrobacterales bacterium]|nr:class I SAM-dependent methyltransferase [Acidiferrobacterales bacterium]
MQDPKLELVQRFFSGTGESYDFMVNFATLGIDRLWKRKIVDLIPPYSTRVLDLACGTGISTFAIANRHPNCHVVGVELRDEYLTLARAKAQKFGSRNVEFVLSRAEDYRSREAFDCVTSSYLAKYADLKRLIPSLRELLKKDGLLIMHDFTFPPKAYLVWIWRCYFWLLQRLGSRLYPAWREIYYGLPDLIEKSRWVSELIQALQEHGFQAIRMEYLTAYGSAIITARR